MKYVLLVAAFALAGTTSFAQGDKSKRPSPPAEAKASIGGTDSVKIIYSQPSLKGREIGKDVEPFEGKVWRAGANEATIFEVSRAVKINGMELPAGKYALFMIAGAREWTIIFNKTWNQWGAFSYKQEDDALRISVKVRQNAVSQDKLTYNINGDVVTLLWGTYTVSFSVN